MTLSRDLEKWREWKRRGRASSAEWARNSRSELSRNSGLSRGKRIRRFGRKAKRDRETGRVFGALADAVRRMPCVACGAPPPNDPHHVASRGSGHGDRLPDGTGNLVPLDRRCHRELHQMGWESFEAKYGVDLAERAAFFGEQHP